MPGKAVRLARLLDPSSGRSVIIPVDHGIVMGAVDGLKDPLDVLARLIELRIDGTLLTPGLWKVAASLFTRRDAPARVLTADLPLSSTLPGEPATFTENELLVSVDFALRHAFDAVKVILLWGLERPKQMANLKLIGNVAEQCDRAGLPLMVEPVLWGSGVPAERKNDPALIESAARIALELGADILKIPYTGEADAFADLVRRLRAPVFVLGGARMGTLADVFTVAHRSVAAGARGIVFGRNVWQHPSMDAVVRGLMEVVHAGIEPETALSNQGLV
jgi:fructose-bisphosphate aldolase, class I